MPAGLVTLQHKIAAVLAASHGLGMLSGLAAGIWVEGLGRISEARTRVVALAKTICHSQDLRVERTRLRERGVNLA
jgi:hypothetical protein